MVSILILEDDPIQINSLKKMIEELGDFKFYIAGNSVDALAMAKNNNIDLFYIDVNLGSSSGLDFALELRTIDKYKLTWILFITAETSYMLDAFTKTHCYDYILKPYSKEKIQETTNSLIENICSKNILAEKKRESIVIDMVGFTLKLYIDEIIFISVYMRTSTIYCKDRTHTAKGLSLKKIMCLINKNNFIQSHKSYYINLDYLSKIDKNQDPWVIYFDNCCETAFVGNKFKTKLRDLHNYL